MASYSKLFLSGSTNGAPIKIGATATPGTLLHTAVSGVTDADEVYIYANNVSTADAEITIEFGGVADPDNLIIVTVPYRQGLILIIPGLVLQNGLVIRAFSGTANVILVTGFVNRITA